LAVRPSQPLRRSRQGKEIRVCRKTSCPHYFLFQFKVKVNVS
jgi:hypothetical protein